MGKREIGELGVFDAIILMSLSNITILGIENYDQNYLYWIIPIFLLTFIQKIISLITLKFQETRKIFDGKESMVIYHGKLVISEMRKNQYNMDDLFTQLRLMQVRSISEVEYAFLESNGKLSVFTFEEVKNTPIYPLPLILSGKIQGKNLLFLKKGNDWLQKELKKITDKEVKDLYCVMYENNKLVIIDTVDLNKI